VSVDLITAVTSSSEQNHYPDQTPYQSLSLEKTILIANTHHISIRQVELAALSENIIPERYARNFKSFSPKDQTLLLNKTACIVGLGGLGGTVTEILARLGIGRLILIDGDRFEDSNLNRQMLSRMALLGTSKAIAARQRVRDINPAVDTVCKNEFMRESNALFLIQGADVIVDCLDNLQTRFMLEKAARTAGIPMVSGAVAGTAGQVTTLFHEDKGLAAVYGDPRQLPEKGVETSLGTLAYTVVLIASLECAEVVKILLNRGLPLKNRLLIVNPADNLYETIML
jgi:molybdopterin-synthase adenylyltransferase